MRLMLSLHQSMMSTSGGKYRSRKGQQMSELTTSQAVRTYEAHPNVLNRLILMGRLTARKNADGHWLISKESLERWNRNRVGRVKPDVAQSTGAGLAHTSA
jgi:hypothetical protein